jgi:hypothetical protein
VVEQAKALASASQVASEDASELTTRRRRPPLRPPHNHPKIWITITTARPTIAFDEDDYSRFDYPQVADTAVKQEVTALLKHYFADAVAANGAAACQLTYSLLA